MNATPSSLSLELERARQLILTGGDESVVYAEWFHHASGTHTTWPDGRQYLAAMLDAERFEGGWSVVRGIDGHPGGVVVGRDGSERAVSPPVMAPENPCDLDLGPGSMVRVDPLAAAEEGGFWHVWSVGWQREVPPAITRLYLDLAPSGALEAIATVAAVAPPGDTWSAKALTGLHDLGRRDGAVLFLSDESDLESEWVRRVMHRLADLCRPGVPPFVRALGPGIGTAPDPGDGRSFGQAVSDAIVSARAHVTDRAEFAAAALAAVARIARTGDLAADRDEIETAE